MAFLTFDMLYFSSTFAWVRSHDVLNLLKWFALFPETKETEINIIWIDEVDLWWLVIIRRRNDITQMRYNYFPKQCIFKYSAKQMQKKMLLHTNADKGSANRPLTGQSFSENKVLPFQDIVFLAGNSTRDSKVNMIWYIWYLHPGFFPFVAQPGVNKYGAGLQTSITIYKLYDKDDCQISQE